MKALRLGVIGYGLRAPVANYAYQPDKNVSICALADLCPETLTPNS